MRATEKELERALELIKMAPWAEFFRRQNAETPAPAHKEDRQTGEVRR